MTYSTTAIFENGVLKPTTPLMGIPEHTIVKISIETEKKPLTNEEQLAILMSLPADEEFAAAIEEGRKKAWKVEEF